MYHNTAKGLAALGRNGDNTLIHVGKNELAGLQALLGHNLTVNPETGFHEAFSLQDILVPIGLGIFGALTGGAGAAALGMADSGLTSAAIGAGSSGIAGGAINKAQGKDFGAGFLGGAVSGGMGGYGASGLGETTPTPSPTAAPTASVAAATGQQGAITGLEGLAKPALPSSPVPKPEMPMTPTGVGTNPNNPDFIGPQGAGGSANPSFSDALGHTFSNMTTNTGMESMLKPIGYGAVLGGGLTSMMNQNATAAQQIRAQKLQNAVNDKQQSDYFNSMGFPLESLAKINNPDSGAQQQDVNKLLWGQGGYAAGGSIEMRRTAGGVPMQTTIPPKFADTFENSDLNHALTTLDQRINTGRFATGGYVNTQPFTGHDFYPQSSISSAHPYAGSAPNSVVNTLSEGASFAEGGSPSSSSFNTTFEAIPTESGHSPIVDVSGRKIAVANISGKTVPFYVSTGGGGKASVPAGKWYPYFGHGPDGWFNKSSEAEIGRYYDSPALKQVAEHLDNTLGDMRHETHFNGQKIPNVSTGSVATQFINQGLNPQPHTFQGSPDDLRGTAQWYKDLESNIKNTVSQVHDSVTRGPTNTPSMLPPAVAPAATQGAKYSVPASLREAVNKYGPTLAKGAGTALNVVGNAAMLLEPDSGREAPDADKPQDYPGEGFNPYYADVPSKAYDKAKWIRTPSGQLMNLTPSFAEGGFLDGPGDGMSDDIPANIDGAEDIRLADGEFVVPPEMVSLIGGGDPEEGKRLLDKLLPMVRQAAHGKKAQIKQDAGKLAAEKMVLRNTARSR